ncbi:TPA: hypothetical protein ACG3KH_004230, partial [Clostridioides difficile]
MNKFDPLEEYLKSKVEITLTLEEIEEILGSELPPSAKNDPTYWGNSTHESRTQARAWLKAGWKVKSKQLPESITFVRN